MPWLPYLLDACQAVGQMPVDVAAIGCDMLAATGRKFLRGPRGTGFLYVAGRCWSSWSRRCSIISAAPWVAPDRYRLRDDARRFETWENNYAARLGLGTAVDYALALGSTRSRRAAALLADGLRHGLAGMPGVMLRDLGPRPSAIVSFTLAGHDAKAVVAGADATGITIGVSNPSSTLLDALARDLPAVIRASPHYYNSEAEIDRLIEHCAGLPAAAASGLGAE